MYQPTIKKKKKKKKKKEGPAFDIYLQLSTEERKDVNKITEEVLKEFERGKRNREEAISELSKRRRENGESVQHFSYKILELVKLAYPTFTLEAQETIAKDYFVNGLHNKAPRCRGGGGGPWPHIFLPKYHKKKC